LSAVAYPLRIELPGRAYHVNAKGVAGCKVFRDDDDREAFLNLIAEELTRSRWNCLAYCLMGTHYHLLIQLDQCTLSSGFQHLNGAYARWFNRKYGRRGAVWQRRFHHVLIESDAHLLEVNRYIALNATRAALCERPEDHLWCGYRAAIGECPPDPLVSETELLSLFGTPPQRARIRLRQFVEERDPRERRSLIRV
jgi:REP-associated tyrosine transposase